MTKTIAVIAAHPDDEALGAAGTLARHAAAGDEVHVIFMADGVGARGSQDGMEERRQAAREAVKAIGVNPERVRFHCFPDNRMDSPPLLEIVQTIEADLAQIGPQIIYTHHAGDLNVDHRVTLQAVLTACRPLPESKVEAIYGFEVLSSTEWGVPDPGAKNTFCPSYYVDIAGFMNAKIKALQSYDTEMRDFPHPRSYEAVEALAKLRGAQAGLERAEAFTVIRQIAK